MSVPDPLPADVAACHALIRQLQMALIETQRKLAVHEENERVRMEHVYGKGATAEELLALGQMLNRRVSDEDRQAIEAELAAEDAMRARRRKEK